MREILFRGKTIEDEWVEGYLFISQEGGCYILDTNNDGDGGIPIRMFLVKHKTIGQYTGLTTNGRIFEHDIVTAKFKSNGARFNFIVKYSNEKGCYVFDNGSVKVPFCDIRSVRIIGNATDNPELLKGGAE